MAKVHSLRAWGSHLTRLRQNAALSGAEVSKRLARLGLHIDRRTIYAYEAGRIGAPDAGVLWGLAKVYGVSPEELAMTLVQYRTGQKPTPVQEATAQELIR